MSTGGGQSLDMSYRSGLRAIDYAARELFRWPNEVPIVDYLKSMGSQHTWWGAAIAGDLRRMEVYLQNGQDPKRCLDQRGGVLFCPTFLSVRNPCVFALYDLLKAD